MICFPFDDEFVIPIFVSILKVIQKHEQIEMKLINFSFSISTFKMQSND